MSRYSKKIEFQNPETFKDKIEAFLKGKSFILVNRRNESTWMRRGMNCEHCIIFHCEEHAIEISAFIVYHNFELKHGGTVWVESKEETESTCKGILGGFGKWPLQKTVKQLEKYIKENSM